MHSGSRQDTVSRHFIVISGRKISVSLEDQFSDGLKESAVVCNIKLDTLSPKSISSDDKPTCRWPFGCSY